ncbi:ATP-binding protein [Planctomycetota bacterium]
MHKRRRILLHFFLGIGLPSLLLGYLAFRGIQNDVALLEEERLNEHNTLAQQICESINDTISAIEGAFLDSIADHQVPQRDSAVLPMLERFKHQHPLVEEVFLFENAEYIQLPLATFLFLPAGSGESIPPAQPSTLLPGRHAEFQQKLYPEALASYQQAFAHAVDSQARAEALNAIARVQTKLQRFPEAIETYRSIAQDYNDVRIPGGMPAGLIAQLELGALFVRVDDADSAVQNLIRAYQDLTHIEWALERSQYEFVVQRIEESIEEISAQAPPLQSYQSTFKRLRDEEKEQREITERLLVFQENAAPNLRAKGPRKREDPRNPARRITLDIGEHTYFVSMPDAQEGNGDRANGTWGLLLDSERLKAKLLQPTIQQYVTAQDIQWTVRNREGDAILESDKPATLPMTVKSSFVGNFPAWSLELYQQDPRLFKTLLASRRVIYLYMFILLAGILIFGLTLTIRIVNHELELGRLKSDFVSTVSHEFKSPLTSIRQLAEMLQAGRVPAEERRQQYYNVLLEQSERLSLLIDNILDFAQMEEGKRAFVFDRVDMGSLLEEVVASIQQRVQHEGFTIKAQLDTPLPCLQADRAAISQAVTNLIDNAVKYSTVAKEVTIRAYTDDRHLMIAVQDFGIGIRPEEMDRVFERFYRGGDELTRTVKGSGLGLTLVKQIVEAHHGSVQVESEPGHGSTFSVKLPLHSAEVK